MSTLATEEDVRAAGNFSSNVPTKTLTFYLELCDYFILEMIGADNYAGTELSEISIDRIKKAEALMTVALALPAISTVTATQGIARTMTMGGSGGSLEVVSFVKEINDLATTFLTMSQQLLAEFVIDEEKDSSIWSSVIMRMFPGLSEMPTVGDMHSVEEERLKLLRGDEAIATSRL